MHLIAAGLNYKTAPVELRERLALGCLCDAQNALPQTLIGGNIQEICALSTCNRTEIYAVTSAKHDGLLTEVIARFFGVDCSEIEDSVYQYAGHHAAAHLFEVACGLDSMVLGETQVLGQVREALRLADEAGTIGQALRGLFQRAITVGRRAHTETGISEGAVSIGAAAVELARFVLGKLEGRTVMIVGAGKMGKLAGVHLISRGIDKLYISNRSPEKAQKLADEFGIGETVAFDDIEQAMRSVDVVISSTSSPDFVVTRDMVERAIEYRKHSPIILIDIAVPRDIEPAVAEVSGVFLYNIDDLEFLVESRRREREAESEKARAIVRQETADFMDLLRTLEAVPLIKLLREKFNTTYHTELDKCLRRLTDLSAGDAECIRKSMKSLANKLTHDPVIMIKEYAANDDAEKLEVVRELFGLPKDIERREN